MSVWIDKKYTNLLSSRLLKFTWKNTNLANFRCPICGDSERNKNKARGYIYKKGDSYYYKCHNCSFSSSFGFFLKRIDPKLYSDYKLELWKNPQITNTTILTSSKKPLENLITKNPYIEFAKKYPCLDSLSNEHIAVQFVSNRLIPKNTWNRIFFLEHAKDISELFPKYKERIKTNEPRLLFPFFNRNGQLVGISTRDILNIGLRYITVKLDSDEPTIFGLYDVNFNERIYVTEGAIDSLFLPNSIAVSGSDLMKVEPILPISKCVMILDNEPRNKEIVKNVEKIIALGWDIFIWPESLPYKDLNECIMNGININDLKRIIDENIVNEIEAELKFAYWRK